MYCNNCGAKNPDNANFCNSCGSRLTGSSGNRSTQTTGSSDGKKGSFFKNFVISLLVFALFYALSYMLTSQGSRDKSASVKNDTGLIQVTTFPSDRAQPEATAPVQDSGYIASMDGYWEDVRLQDGSFNLNVSALTFNQTIYNCTGLTVNMNVQMNAGTNCKDWQLWGRSGNSYVKLAKIYLPAGDGYVSQSVTFTTPVTIDSVAITPTIVGSYSWSMSLDITDVWTD